MTKQELSNHMELKRRLEADLELLASLESVGGLDTEIADVKMAVGQLEAEIARSETAIADYITTIQDTQTRMIFRLRFLHGMTWKEVASATGGRNTESGVKAVCCRYIERGGPARMGRPPKKRD